MLVAVLAAPAPLAQSAPRKDGDQADWYYPTTVGDAWVVEVDFGGKVYDYRETVTAVTVTDGEAVVTVRRQEKDYKPKASEFRVSDRGVTWAAFDGKPLDPPIPQLRLPARPGETWERAPPAGGESTVRTTYKIGKAADVEVPAGKFRAVAVEVVSVENGEVLSRLTYWHAPGRGVVKVEGVTSKLEFRQVLKAFTPGKK